MATSAKMWKETFRNLFRGDLSAAWQALDEIPDCPACNGTGEVNPRYASWTKIRYWKGKPYEVCHNCKGEGKV